VHWTPATGLYPLSLHDALPIYRLGPNRVGPGGLGQPVADGLKNILKEESNPGQAHRLFFILAPMLAITPAMVTFAVIPFAAPLRSEEHTSELQSRENLVCRLLL